jgi:hypothetical protein
VTGCTEDEEGYRGTIESLNCSGDWCLFDYGGELSSPTMNKAFSEHGEIPNESI